MSSKRSITRKKGKRSSKLEKTKKTQFNYLKIRYTTWYNEELFALQIPISVNKGIVVKEVIELIRGEASKRKIKRGGPIVNKDFRKECEKENKKRKKQKLKSKGIDVSESEEEEDVEYKQTKGKKTNYHSVELRLTAFGKGLDYNSYDEESPDILWEDVKPWVRWRVEEIPTIQTKPGICLLPVVLCDMIDMAGQKVINGQKRRKFSFFMEQSDGDTLAVLRDRAQDYMGQMLDKNQVRNMRMAIVVKKNKGTKFNVLTWKWLTGSYPKDSLWKNLIAIVAEVNKNSGETIANFWGKNSYNNPVKGGDEKKMGEKIKRRLSSQGIDHSTLLEECSKVKNREPYWTKGGLRGIVDESTGLAGRLFGMLYRLEVVMERKKKKVGEKVEKRRAELLEEEQENC